jgi:hypothetical protein
MVPVLKNEQHCDTRTVPSLVWCIDSSTCSFCGPSLKRKYRNNNGPGTDDFQIFGLGMHRILFLPDIRRAGYPANPKAGYLAGYLVLQLYFLSNI